MKSQIKQTSEQGKKILLETKGDTANDKRINLPGRHNNPKYTHFKQKSLKIHEIKWTEPEGEINLQSQLGTSVPPLLANYRTAREKIGKYIET